MKKFKMKRMTKNHFHKLKIRGMNLIVILIALQVKVKIHKKKLLKIISLFKKMFE
jgi:hypothetical protein